MDAMPPRGPLSGSDELDSEGDFRFLEELLINDSLPLPENESYNLDSVDNPESPVVKSCFYFEPVVAVTNDFDVLNNDESFDSGESLGFSGFWKTHGFKIVEGLSNSYNFHLRSPIFSSLKMGNLLILVFIELNSILLACP
ncbi:hypothetical protein Tco_0868543 [Tanacetum coccineum]